MSGIVTHHERSLSSYDEEFHSSSKDEDDETDVPDEDDEDDETDVPDEDDEDDPGDDPGPDDFKDYDYGYNDDQLGVLVDIQRQPAMDDHMYSSRPYTGSLIGGFMSRISYRNRPSSMLSSLSKDGISFESSRSYQTSSTISSYKTAPLAFRGSTPSEALHSSTSEPSSSVSTCGTYDQLKPFIDRIIDERSNYIDMHLYPDELRTSLKNIMQDVFKRTPSYFWLTIGNLLYAKITENVNLQKDERRSLSSAISRHTDHLTASQKNRIIEEISINKSTEFGSTWPVFSSTWLENLKSRGIILDPMDELDWSGRGQHVEYKLEEENDIPLKTEKILGHSATAIVDSVLCRRIRLARKRIRCSRRLSKEDAITEVEHLQRLNHSHIVRVVGTYTLKNDLAILLYPAAEYDLEQFMDDTQNSVNESEWMIRTSALRNFLSCLIHAIHFLHDQNLKHMDIKPKNVLVQRSSITPRTVESYKVYIADFGIARAYQFPTEAETDSPTSYTRKYAAPEVVRQDKRGFSADIFSLGCVFMEIISTVFHAADEQPELETMRCHKNGDSSYHANIEAVRNWYHSVGQTRWQWAKQSDQRYMYINPGLIAALPRMIDELPELRPTAGELKEYTSTSCCSKGLDGPEPFEYAKSI